MPPKYSKGRKTGMKALKRGKSNLKRLVAKAKTKSLVKLIKKVSLNTQETKDTHTIVENTQLYHNTPAYHVGLLKLRQGMGDAETGTQQLAKRIGDEIYARGLSLKMWFANKLDRPDILYKLIVFKYRADTTINAGDPYHSQGTANFMIRDVNTEKFKIVKVKNFRICTSAQRITLTDVFNGAEGHRAVKMWIPINKKIKYDETSSNGETPKLMDYGISVVCYDSFGTQLTDNIASFAINFKLYFKDA